MIRRSAIGLTLAGALLVACPVWAQAVAPERAPDALGQAESEARKKTAVLKVEGVSCAGCSTRIRKELKGLSGVEDVREGGSKSEILVDFDSGKASPAELVARVEKAGFSCSIVAIRKRS